MFYTNVARIGKKILVRGYTKRGERYQEAVDYQPRLWFPLRGRAKPDYVSLFGEPLEVRIFNNVIMAQTRIDFCEMSNIPVFGLTNWTHTFINDQWPEEIDVDRSLVRIVNMDIEVHSPNEFPHPDDAKYPVNLIQLSFRGQKFVFGCGDYTPQEHVRYYHCDNERQLLSRFLRVWKRIDPDIVTGWNVLGFDVPYLTNRIATVFENNKARELSPWGMVWPKEQLLASGFAVNTFEWCGVAVIDYLECYRKFRLKIRESYRLDYIGHVELNLKKISFEEYSSLAHLADENFQRFVEYGVRDLEIVDKLDQKLGYLDLVMSMAYFTRVNYADVFRQTRMWDCLLQNRLMKKNIILPAHSHKIKDRKVRGAFVKPPQVGLHRWVASFDLASLYPSSTIALNIGPETIDKSKFREFSVDDLITKDIRCEYPDYTLAANGHYFRRTPASHVAEAVKDVLIARKIEKNKMLDCEREIEKLKNIDPNHEDIAELKRQASTHNTNQSVFKVIGNSSYGTLASNGFRLFDPDVAEAITVTGQALVQWAARDVNTFLNQYFKTREPEDFVVAQDTDSMYVRLDKIARLNPGKELDAVEQFCAEHLTPLIDRSVKALEARLNTVESRWVFKMETISDRAIWTGKKRYILNKLVSEAGRLTEPDIKVTGIEAVRSTTPEAMRDSIKNAIKIIMTKEEADIQKYIKAEYERFMSLPLEEIAFTTGCGDLTKYEGNDRFGVRKGTPQHIKSIFTYNHFITEMGLGKKYKKIGSSDKIKFLTLLEPNPYDVTAMAFIDGLPPEFGLEYYIDKENQFNRTFLRPLERILTAIDWSSKKRRTLAGLKVRSAAK